jgi:hypothetical protein
MSPVHTTPSYFSNIHLSIILPLTCSLRSGLFPSSFPTKTLRAFFFDSMHDTRPTIIIDFLILIILGKRVQVMKPLIMQFSPTSYYCICLQSKYSPQHPVPKYLQSMFSLQCQRPSSNPYKITVLYIFIFMLLDSKQEDRRFWTEW